MKTKDGAEKILIPLGMILIGAIVKLILETFKVEMGTFMSAIYLLVHGGATYFISKKLLSSTNIEVGKEGDGSQEPAKIKNWVLIITGAAMFVTLASMLW